MLVCPERITPSIGTRSPGFTQQRANGDLGHRHGGPTSIGLAHRRLLGRHLQQALIAFRARSTACASIASAIAYSAITMAASATGQSRTPRHCKSRERIDVQAAMSQSSQTLLVDIEAGEPDRHRRYGEAGGTPDRGLRREIPEGLGRDSHCAPPPAWATGRGRLRGRARRPPSGLLPRPPLRAAADRTRLCESPPARALSTARRHRQSTAAGRVGSVVRGCRQPVEGSTDFSLLGGAVHRGNAKAATAPESRSSGKRRRRHGGAAAIVATGDRLIMARVRVFIAA